VPLFLLLAFRIPLAPAFSPARLPQQGPAPSTRLRNRPPTTATALKGRPLALGIMRTRGQGFVPSRELQDYVRGRHDAFLLAGVKLSFVSPSVRSGRTPNSPANARQTGP